MNVFLTGATGYVGNQICQDLLDAGHTVYILVRPGSESKISIQSENLIIVSGNALDRPSYDEAISQCEAIINIIGIIREFPRKGITYEKLHVRTTQLLIDAAKAHEITRFIQMSALGVKPDSPSGYFTSKAAAEARLRESGLDYTIFRPSVIYGPDDEFIHYFVGIMRNFHVIPIIGAGHYRMQPVSLYDVSQAFVRTLSEPESYGKTYELAGPDRYEYTEMMKLVRESAGITALPIHMPKLLMSAGATLFQHFAFFPVTRSQIVMLYDENITDDMRAFELFDITPTPFRRGIADYL